MRTYAQRKKKQQTDQKKRLVLKMMSSFVVTAVVAAVVIFAPAAPTAEITAESFGNAIYYETLVKDVDATLLEGSLKVVFESSFQTFEEPLDPGIDSGTATGLRGGTEYQVSVRASRGFGEETLAKATVTTDSGFGGRISEINLVGSAGFEPQYAFLTYGIKTVCVDLYAEMTGLRLKYAYLYSYELETMPYPTADLFTTLDIGTLEADTLIEGIPDMNVTVFLVLEADLATGETVILHERTFRTPVSLHGSIYVTDVRPNAFDVAVYADFTTVPGITYRVLLKQNGVIRDAVALPEPIGSQMESGSSTVTFQGLAASTLYHCGLEATYQDPDSGETITEMVIGTDVMTTAEYDSTVTFEDLGTTYLVTLTVWDPSGLLSNYQCVAYALVEAGYEYYVSSVPIVLTDAGNGWWTGQTTLARPAEARFVIRLTCQKTIGGNFIYYGCVLGETEGVN